MPKTIHDILEYFREEAKNNRDLGDRFERLIVAYLEKDPFYADKYEKVWLWTEWPLRANKPDTGIDIVAQERATGDYHAIQCKFFDPERQLQKADIDSFFTASGREPFKHRIIVSTTDKWSVHAEHALTNQQIPVSRLRVQDLDESPIDWSGFKPTRPQDLKLKAKKELRKHQDEALAHVLAGLNKADRGKLIMACGTGKTFTSLKIAEASVPDGGNVLFLVPSISLLSQTLLEWSAEAQRPISSFAVCSDSKVGKKNDEEDISIHDLAFPAHTKPSLLVKQLNGIKAARKKNISVIFSTYQSIGVVAEAQKHGVPEFDLVICDEAHRTTGVEQDSKDFSNFIAIHKPNFIKAKKRLYMTATPRIYDDASKGKAKEAEIEIFSMDDVSIYGEELHRLDFSEAVRRGLLSDYKVMVLAVDEKYVNKAFQRQLADENNELALDDLVKIVGCYNGLKKRMIKTAGDGGDSVDPAPMRRAVAFSRSIRDSKKLTELFATVIKDYQSETIPEGKEESKTEFLRCEVDHVDGTFNALVRNERLQWLKEDTTKEGNICRILSNVRCLSEGVDVPALDAVMFLNPRNSVVDVVQSVGRVMRKAAGKQYGYIILPIGVPADIPPEEALSDNQKYKVVWQVLQALRAHDDRFNAIINQIDLNTDRTDKIQIIGIGGDEQKSLGKGDGSGATQSEFSFPLEDWENAIFAKIVVKCGNRRYWESWAQDVAKIAERHVLRITALLESVDSTYRNEFDSFLDELRKTLNPSISESDAIEMLSQHLITKPVFDALFEGYEFTKHNPVSKTMQHMLDLIEGQSLEKETVSLDKFYESVKERARGIDNPQGKQKLIVELYDKFFRAAFPRMAERLGIVYTPVEVADFILNSANDALLSEFGVGITDKNVHILDAFTGTGTFIVRLLQSEIIKDKDLLRKFQDELHANEIVLLAYYIAAINIEEAFYGRMKQGYQPFEGIVLTDTFQMSENTSTLAEKLFPENNQRSERQRKKEIRVIVGNPPYSVGQNSANDANQNIKYPRLDDRIRTTYAANSMSTNKNSLYNSYIRAIRWASDRIGSSGIICYISPASLIDGNAMNGIRQCLTEEFTSIYCFNLRGNANTSGEDRRKEKGNVFGGGTKTPVAITLLIKNPKKAGKCTISYFEIGDYLSREQKLGIIQEFRSTKGIPWRLITPNTSHDWINQRDEAFGGFMPIGEKETKGDVNSNSMFVTYSRGVATSRDAWAYNYSGKSLSQKMKSMIAFFNGQVEHFQKAALAASPNEVDADSVLDNDSKKISWSRGLKNDIIKNRKGAFNSSNIRLAIYRPFTKQFLYFHRQFNDMIYRTPQLFPEPDSKAPVICLTGLGSTKEFSALMLDTLPDLEVISKGQCFPLKTFITPSDTPNELELGDGAGASWRENITGYACREYVTMYKDKNIGKEDIFYYVYGILHSLEYKRRFEADLKKMLPRIPFTSDFWAFSKAGRKLASIHLNYETAMLHPVKEKTSELNLDAEKFYKVEKMRFGKNSKEVDKTTIHYNSRITLSGIPLEAYEYIVNGKSAIEWIMERYQFSVDKDSQIANDPNDWAKEHDEPKYILNLLKRIITVSIETMKVVKSLPALNEKK